MASVFDEIKTRLTITDVCQRYGVQLDRHNKCRCPLHKEKTASFVVYPARNSFFCYGCNTGGSVVDFAAKYHNLEPLAAARLLDADFNLGLFERDMSAADRAKQADARAERAEQKAIADDFQDWSRSFLKFLCNKSRTLAVTIEAEAPKDINNPMFTEKHADSINEKQIIDYWIDILLSDDLSDKMTLYLQVRAGAAA